MVEQELVADPVELVVGDARARRAAPTSCSACAAIRPAMRIFSIVSASLTSGPVNGAGAGLSTYSGRGMCVGTGRRGEIVPGATGVTSDECSFGDHERVLVLPQPPCASSRRRLRQLASGSGPYPLAGGGVASAGEGPERNEEWDKDDAWGDGDLED